MTDQFRIEDPLDFERHVGMQCKRLGYEVIMPDKNQRGYDIELRKDGEKIAVQVKNHKAKSNISQLSKFQEFLELPIGAEFTSGWFISASGFSKPALTAVSTENPDNLKLGISEHSGIRWAYSPDGTIDSDYQNRGFLQLKAKKRHQDYVILEYSHARVGLEKQLLPHI